MIEVELRLEPAGAPQRPATAWLISGDDPLRWLAEIAAWKLDEAKLTLFVLPQSCDDLAPSGVLVVGNDPRAIPARTPAALPFGRAAEGFYVPTHAHLLPVLSEAELAGLKQCEAVVFHPALGPIGFGVEEALGVWDLLASPPEREARWAAPPVEIAPHPRLESIAFRAPLSLAAIFGAEAAEIGSGSPEELPPAEGEPREGALQRGWRKLQESLGKSDRESPQTAGFRRMQQWIANNLQGRARDLALARSRALMRLLDQLQKNPDEGLKRALPLGGTGQHRGVAPPAADLGSRAADFSLDRLRGGRAADFWQVPPDLLLQLRMQYLELAERERQLGRFRRAAYIYAELLGDLLAAARVLAEGAHWREAGTLYRDHLGQGLEAARCFVQARMIPEAIALYEKAGAHEALGELYEKLGDAGKAALAFRRWSQQLIAERRFLKAAEVLEHKLLEREKALELLLQPWPAGEEALPCIERRFAMHAAAGEHERAAETVRRAAAAAGGARAALLLRLLGGLQTSYPDRRVRAVAEDCGRREFARCFGQHRLEAHHHVLREAARLLPGLAPDDRLLARDAQRFLDSVQRGSPMPAPLPKAQSSAVIPVGTHPAHLTLLREFSLPATRVQWMKATAAAQGFCVIGSGRGGAELARCTFEGATQTVRWHGSELPEQTIPEFLLCMVPGAGERIFAAVYRGAPLSEHALPATGLFSAARAGCPPWLSDAVLAAAGGMDGALWVLRETPTGAVVSGFQEHGQLVATFPAPALTLPARTNGPTLQLPRMHLAASGQELLCAAGGALHRCTPAGDADRSIPEPVAEFEEAITGLEASPPWGAPHVAVVLERRIAICWLGVHQGRTHLLDAEAPGAIAGFSSDRILVALTRDAGFLFDSDSRGRLRSARFGWKGAAPLAVLRGPAARTFTIIDVNGIVRIFGFSSADLK